MFIKRNPNSLINQDNQINEIVDGLEESIKSNYGAFSATRTFNGLIFSHCLPGAATLVTGTIICPKNSRKVKLCLKENPKVDPMVFVEVPLGTTEFTGSIDSGVLRIVLDPVPDSGITHRWLTYCNGQKVGFSRRLEVGQEEKWVLEMMQMVRLEPGFCAKRFGRRCDQVLERPV
ncbi:CAP protein [Hibiscus syriacus]|uniref:CAP protein n=1 Tax=Hibiscus syriacus TaxID=106335 RepID=A0A6A2XRX6_HIBSY|nr:uncharacterized protein LOC120171824 [Hibiscus syriacus]KAE8672620.1 CAP protein [Hibiscus syriacus]